MWEKGQFVKIRLIDLGQKVIHHNHNSFLFCEDFSLSQFSKVHSAREEGEGKNHILIWILGWMSLANGCKNGFTAQFNIQLPQPTAAFYNIWAVYFFQNLTNVCRLSTGFWRWQRPWWLLLRRQRPRWLLLRRRRRTWRRSGHRGRRPLHIRVEWLNKSLYLKKKSLGQ